MFTAIIEILRSEFNLGQSLDLPISTFFTALMHKKLWDQTALYMNHRQTIENIKLIKASAILFHKGLLSMKEMRTGIKAFELMVFKLNDDKELTVQNLPLQPKILNQTLRLINKTISLNLIEHWVKTLRSDLDCEDKDLRKLEEFIKERENIFKMQNPD